MAAATVLDVKSADWQKEVEKSALPVVVDFWAQWCQPCRILGPMLDEMAKEFSGKVKFVKVNVDENQDLAQKHRVRNLPTMLIMSRGQVQEQITGVPGKEALKEKVQHYVGK